MENNIEENNTGENNTDIKIYNNFDSMGINDNILRGIYSYGFENPSSVQQKGIVPIIENHDCIIQSQSGTGKTATFCIGNLQIIDEKETLPQSLIIAPTRELADQIFNVMKELSNFTNINILKCVGGESLQQNLELLKERSNHVIIGTPGRILNLLRDKYLNPSKLKILTMDEADECLSHGFVDQIYDIFQKMPKDIQVILLSATMPHQMLNLTKEFMRNPKQILVKKENITLEGIKQYYVDCEKNQFKFDVLCEIYEIISVSQCIIYCNTIQQLNNLSHALIKNDFSVTCIHGSMDTNQRNEIMTRFRNGDSRILLSTDLLSRGIDIQQVSLVINYDIPSNYESYIHRIGRSGRYGRKGVSINICSKYDIKKIKEIEKIYKTKIEPLPDNFENII